MKLLRSLFLVLGILTASSASAYIDEALAPFEVMSPYKPMYLLSGHPDTKIQFSLKVRAFKGLPLHLAYSQLMVWKIFVEKSAPFRDSNYNPEIFYRINLSDNENQEWLDVGIYEHESNGRAGEESRSWDRVYLRYSDTIKLHDEELGSKFHWNAKAWLPVRYGPQNRDMAQYRGLMEFNFTITRILGELFKRNDLSLRIYPAGKYYLNPLKGAQELTFRAEMYTKLTPLFIFQLFHGYGENMLDYNDRVFALRVGIGF